MENAGVRPGRFVQGSASFDRYTGSPNYKDLQFTLSTPSILTSIYAEGEMAAIAARFKQLDPSGVGGTAFHDVEMSYWGAGYIEAARSAGIIDGYGDGTFKPNGHLTRAEAVKIINRLFERGPLHGIPQPSWSDVPATHWAYYEIEEASEGSSLCRSARRRRTDDPMMREI